MYRDLLRTIRQLPDPRFQRVLVTSLLLAAALFAGLVLAIGWALERFAIFDRPWLDAIVDLLGFFAFVWVAILLFPALATTIQSLLLERVAQAVEARWYPDRPAPRDQPWTEIAGAGARLGLLILFVNLIALPVYLALTFVFPLNLAFFYAVNGFLLGREYFETVALRRMPPEEARRLRRAAAGRVWLAGAVIAAIFSVPLLNLAAPVLGTTLMLHLFERLRPQSAGGMPAMRDADWRSGMAGLLLVALAAAGAQTASLARLVEAGFLGRPRPVRASATPGELIGRGQIEIWNRLGSPDLVRREGPARVWQYLAGDCVLDLFLYASGEDFEVIHVAMRSRSESGGADPACYRRIIERAPAAPGHQAAARTG